MTMESKGEVHYGMIKQDITKFNITIKSLVQEIRDLKGSQADLDNLGSLVRTKIVQLRAQIDELRKVAIEQDNETDKLRILQEVAQFEKQLQENHKAFRNALLHAQLKINERCKDELLSSEELIENSSGDEFSLRHRDKMSKEMMMKKSSQLTDDLLTVTRMIRDNTEKSAKTLDTLVESSQVIGSTQEELKTMGSAIAQARKILSKYGRRENTDKLLILLGLIFFLASCLVVLRNRFIF